MDAGLENTIVDAVLALCKRPNDRMMSTASDSGGAGYDNDDDGDDAASEMQHVSPVVRASLMTFRGSMASLVRCLRSCSNNCDDPPSAACNILLHLFSVATESEAEKKCEPLALDEAALSLRESDRLVGSVERFLHEARTSIDNAARECALSSGFDTKKAIGPHIVDGGRCHRIQEALDHLDRLKSHLGHFLTETVKTFRVRVVDTIQIEKRLGFLCSNWKAFTAAQQQHVGVCVAAEVQCRLEHRWFSQFFDHLRSGMLSGVSDEGSLSEFERRWVREWSSRRTMLQDRLLNAADTVLAAARHASAFFPALLPEADVADGVKPLQIPQTFIMLSPSETPPTSSSDFASKFLQEQRLAHNPDGQRFCGRRDPLHRPRSVLSRAMGAATPSLSVVELSGPTDTSSSRPATTSPKRPKKHHLIHRALQRDTPQLPTELTVFKVDFPHRR